MSQVCLCVQSFKSFFVSAMFKSNNKSDDSPIINRNVQYFINARHFDSNAQLVDVIKPISDAIGRLENQHATIMDVMIDIFKIAKQLKAVPDDNPFKEVATLTFARRVKVFDNCSNFLALHLSPNHKALAVSKKYSLDNMRRRMFEIVRELN